MGPFSLPRLLAVAVLIAAVIGTLAIVGRVWPAAPATAQAAKPIRKAAPTPAPRPTAEPLVVKSVLPIAGPLKFGKHHWDESRGVSGPLVITVDLEAQVLSGRRTHGLPGSRIHLPGQLRGEHLDGARAAEALAAVREAVAHSVPA